MYGIREYSGPLEVASNHDSRYFCFLPAATSSYSGLTYEAHLGSSCTAWVGTLHSLLRQQGHLHLGMTFVEIAGGTHVTEIRSGVSWSFQRQVKQMYVEHVDMKRFITWTLHLTHVTDVQA